MQHVAHFGQRAGWVALALGALPALAAEKPHERESSVALAPPPVVQAAEIPQYKATRYLLVEEFTAATLGAGEVKLGTEADFGLSARWMIGTDLVAGAVGAPSLQVKYLAWQTDEHQVALGFRAAYLSRKTLLWGSANEHFDELDARIVRPQLAWTNALSPRLKLHTFWAKGFGRIRAQLSDKGKRKLWETKHPGADYEKRDALTKQPTGTGEKDDGAQPSAGETAAGGSDNLEKQNAQESSLTQRSVQVQSITGLAQDRFQLTGEFTRKNGNKVLVTSRIEQSEFESLKSNFFRLTAAHQWIWTNFQMRLGIGVQYFVMSGRDLDGEQIDEAGVQPASDISFYWRF